MNSLTSTKSFGKERRNTKITHRVIVLVTPKIYIMIRIILYSDTVRSKDITCPPPPPQRLNPPLIYRGFILQVPWEFKTMTSYNWCDLWPQSSRVIEVWSTSKSSVESRLVSRCWITPAFIIVSHRSAPLSTTITWFVFPFLLLQSSAIQTPHEAYTHTLSIMNVSPTSPSNNPA